MTRSSRKFGLALALVALALPASADVQDTFQEGQDLYRRGKKAEALAKFHEVLAGDPTNEMAWRMWQAADQDLFIDLMMDGGEYHKVSTRLQTLATAGRRELQRDQDAIDELVANIRGTSNIAERRQMTLALNANHGEFAVPRLIAGLADAGDENWRVLAMHTLTQMGPGVVQPLIAALGSEDNYQRANICFVLGRIGDGRAAAYLQHAAETSDDEGVQLAAGKAAMECNASGSTLDQLLRLGDDYHHRRSNVLRSFDYSDVLWGWDGELVSNDVPKAIYNNELAKRAYYTALAVDANSLDALAGIARESTDIVSKVEHMAMAGEDVDALLPQAEAGSLAVAAAGVEAVDRALAWSVVSDDPSSAIYLCRALGEMAGSPTDSLNAALDSEHGSMRGEAAAALGLISLRSRTAASASTVNVLGASAAREVVRIAVVIDANAERAAGVVAALEADGVLVNHRDTGASGVDLLTRIPGCDVVMLGDGLPDLTIDQIFDVVQGQPRTMGSSIVVMTSSEEFGDAWSDRATGISSGADDMSAVEEIFAAGFDGDRLEADMLAARSASILTLMAVAGTSDLSGIADGLTSPLAHRDDWVTMPCMDTLSIIGSADHVPALMGVLADGSRTSGARISAADAISGILGRNTGAAGTYAEAITAIVGDGGTDASVRAAAARALGSAGSAGRAALMSGIRVEVRTDG